MSVTRSCIDVEFANYYSLRYKPSDIAEVMMEDNELHYNAFRYDDTAYYVVDRKRTTECCCQLSLNWHFFPEITAGYAGYPGGFPKKNL